MNVSRTLVPDPMHDSSLHPFVESNERLHPALLQLRRLISGKPLAVGLQVPVQRQTDLLEVVLAMGSPGRLAGSLDRGEQQPDQNADDGNDHQQFDQREAPSPVPYHSPPPRYPEQKCPQTFWIPRFPACRNRATPRTPDSEPQASACATPRTPESSRGLKPAARAVVIVVLFVKHRASGYFFVTSSTGPSPGRVCHVPSDAPCRPLRFA